MKHLKEVTKTVKELDYCICDKCGVKVEDLSIENEIVSLSNVFGFSSKRDGKRISFDLCEDCFMETIKNINYREEDVSLWEVE